MSLREIRLRMETTAFLPVRLPGLEQFWRGYRRLAGPRGLRNVLTCCLAIGHLVAHVAQKAITFHRCWCSFLLLVEQPFLRSRWFLKDE